LAIVSCAVVVARRAYRPALLFLGAWTMLLIGIFVYAMVSFGALPKTFATEYGIQIGSAAEMIFLSFALSYRWAGLRIENERIARESSEKLERRVSDRTTELQRALDELERANLRLREWSERDGLTGVYNRRHLDTSLEPMLRAAQDQHQACTLFIVDIDHFKLINDEHGHLAGDDCLRMLARVLQEGLGADALFARFGGEEFVLLLPGVDELTARRRGEDMRQRVASEPVTSDDQVVRITVSVGAATILPNQLIDARTLLRRADEALYEAKHNGRNRVVQRMAAA
jgi:two-component system, sensor histidine kinase LadS